MCWDKLGNHHLVSKPPFFKVSNALWNKYIASQIYYDVLKKAYYSYITFSIPLKTPYSNGVGLYCTYGSVFQALCKERCI